MGVFIFPFDYLSLFRRKDHSTSISIRFHQCERWRKWKGKCFAESFAERLKLSLKPSTVLSTVTGELPEFHGNQTSAVSFWFRTSEKTPSEGTPPKIYIPKTTRIHPPKKNNYAITTPKARGLDKLLVRLKVSTSMIFVSANSWSA